MARFATALLDLDGTLSDPRQGITRCIQHALRGLDRPTPHENELLWCIGPPLRRSFARLLESEDPTLLDRALALYRARFSTVGMYENAVYDGIPQALDRVRRAGVRLVLATSKPRVYAVEILRHFGLTEHFAAIHGSELDGRRTEKADLIAHVLEAERLALEGTIMVGDREHDVAGARVCGLRSGAVTYGFGNAEELARARPDFLFDSPWTMSAFLVDDGGRDGAEY